MNSFHLTVLGAEKPFFEGECESLVFPTTDGLAGVQAHHDNMITALVPGTLKFRTPDGKTTVAAVSAGMVKVENGEVLILTGTAERPEEIDAARARREAEEAKEAMLQQQSIREYRLAEARMARALSRLKVKKSVEDNT